MAKGKGGRDVPKPAASASRLAPKPAPSKISSRSKSPTRNLPKPVTANTNRSKSPQRPPVGLSPGASSRAGVLRQDGIRMVKGGGATADKPTKSNKVSPKPLSMVEMDKAAEADAQSRPTVFGTRKPPSTSSFLTIYSETVMHISKCSLLCKTVACYREAEEARRKISRTYKAEVQ